MCNSQWFLSVALAASVIVGLNPAAAGTVGNIALVGDASPDGGFPYVEFVNLEVGGAGTNPSIVFSAKTRSTITKKLRHCLFKLDSASEGVLACGDSPVSGLGYRNFTGVSVNASGTAAWAAVLTDGRTGIFREGPSAVSLAGDAAPGGGFLASVSNPTMTDSGAVVFMAVVNGDCEPGPVPSPGCPAPGSDKRMFRCATTCPGGAGLETLLRPDQGISDRSSVDRVCDILEVAASDWGIAFHASTSDIPCHIHFGLGARGVFRMQFGHPIETVALEDEPANASPPSGAATYRVFSAPAIEDHGLVAFHATTSGLVEGAGVYACDPATCAAAPADLAVAAGSADAQGRILHGLSAPVLSNAADIAFHGRGTSACNVYIRRSSDGSVETVAAKGDPAPAEPGSTFGCLGAPSISGDGTVVFPGGYTRPSKPKTGKGIFLFED